MESMSTRILANTHPNEGETGAILFDGTTSRAYGCVFESYEQADAFVRWAMRDGAPDPGRLTIADLDVKQSEFIEKWYLCGLSNKQVKRYTDLNLKCFGQHWKLKNRDEYNEHVELIGVIANARVEMFGESE